MNGVKKVDNLNKDLLLPGWSVGKLSTEHDDLLVSPKVSTSSSAVHPPTTMTSEIFEVVKDAILCAMARHPQWFLPHPALSSRNAWSQNSPLPICRRVVAHPLTVSTDLFRIFLAMYKIEGLAAEERSYSDWGPCVALIAALSWMRIDARFPPVVPVSSSSGYAPFPSR